MPTKFLSRLANSRFFGRYLLATNTVTSGVLMAIGDCGIQKMERVRAKDVCAKHDWSRTGRMFCVGIIQGPVSHGWYQILDKFLIGTSAKIITKKILLDQIIASPAFAWIFFMGMGTLERKPPTQSFGEFKYNFWKVYKMDWVVWPAAQAVNFYYLPNQYRVLYVALVTLGWDMYLSAVKHEVHEPVVKSSPIIGQPSLKSDTSKTAHLADKSARVTDKVSIVAESVTTS